MNPENGDGAPRVRIADLTWPEFDRRVREEGAVVIIPTGALEQHGPHLPLSTDTVIPTEIAARVAERIGALVAPPVPYGFKSQPKSGGGNHFPGTVSFDASTLIAVVRDLINEFARHGARKIVLFDGHMENQWFLVEAADLAIRDRRREGQTDLKVAKIGYWEFIDQATLLALFPGGNVNWELEHAAVMETSVMLHLRPDLVRAPLIPDHPPADFPKWDVYPFDTRPIPPDGVLSSAASATAEKGRIVLDQIVPALAAAVGQAFA